MAVTTKKEITQKLYNDVRVEYHQMKSVKEHNVSKYSYEYIIQHLSAKYYKAPKTIENIIWGRV